MSAVRDGDEYVLNGTKRYISNGSMAKLYFIIARTDMNKNLSEGGAVFVVPHDTPGFRVGFFHEKSSQRLATNGTFHLEDCRVPVSNLLVGEGMLTELRSKYLPGSKAEAAATVLGVGRAAYEYALAYAKEPRPGRPADHPAPGRRAHARAAWRCCLMRLRGYKSGRRPGSPTDTILTLLGSTGSWPR